MRINQRKRPDHRGNNKHYQSKDHKWWRKHVLAKSKGLCVHCKEEGRITRATVADHIQPIELGGDPLDINNGQGLCSHHHAKKSAHERWMREL